MQVQVLATNGGPHPPDVWATVTASAIGDRIQIDPASDSAAATTARLAKPQFIATLTGALYPIFRGVADDESANVASGATPARNSAFNINPSYMTQAMAAISNAASGTPFQAFFADPNTQSVCQSIIQQNFLDSANITRSWAFDAKGL